ncbi:MAG: hypothetical protein R6X10_17545 [Desulfobacterales bacterium]
MKIFLFYTTVVIITLGLSINSLAEVIYFNSNHVKITQEEYQKISDSWRMKIKDNIAQREAGVSEDADETQNDQILEDPVKIRKKRIEQWKAFRAGM